MFCPLGGFCFGPFARFIVASAFFAEAAVAAAATAEAAVFPPPSTFFPASPLAFGSSEFDIFFASGCPFEADEPLLSLPPCILAAQSEIRG